MERSLNQRVNPDTLSEVAGLRVGDVNLEGGLIVVARQTYPDLHMLQRVAGHQDPAVTSGYLHPDMTAVLAAGSAFSVW